MNLDDYHASAGEQARVADLMALLPTATGTALDIGARDGFIARKLADRIPAVTALDLTLPTIDDPRIRCVVGDAAALSFGDASFDLVFCAEVLEHIPSPALERACAEIARVARRHVLIGVPYRQDIRLWRTTCGQCGAINPPWSHVNSFDDTRLRQLFPGLRIVSRNEIGQAEPDTNALSAWLMDCAGNPYGTYVQDEPCAACHAALKAPGSRLVTKRLLARAALILRRLHNLGRPPHANWIHLLLAKP